MATTTYKNPRYYRVIGPKEVGPNAKTSLRGPHVDVDDGEVNLASVVPVRVERDQFDRIYFEACDTDLKHFTTPPREGDERRGCRIYLDELFNHMVGKRGLVFVSIDFDED